MENEFEELEELKMNPAGQDEEDFDEDDEEEDEDEGISFEKYAELSAKTDPFGNDMDKQKQIIQTEGYTWDDWEFYKNVWEVETLTDNSKTQKFAEIYSKFAQKNN